MKTASLLFKAVLLLGAAFLLAACSSAPTNKGAVAGTPFEARHLIQSDFNRVASLGMKNNLASLQLLMDKLYKRNPREWKKTAPSLEEAKILVWKAVQERKAWTPLAGKKDTVALSYALDAQFEGDRVAAFVAACADMLIAAHNGEVDFTMLSRLEAQHIYNAARNIDTAAWILASRKLPTNTTNSPDKEGEAILLSDEINATVRNTSFSKELGAISARLDLVAQLMSEKYQRLGVGIVQTLIAGPILQFLPVR